MVEDLKHILMWVGLRGWIVSRIGCTKLVPDHLITLARSILASVPVSFN